jgi:hypothetical protein
MKMANKKRTNKELKELALAITTGAVFTDAQVKPQDKHLLSMIFMPLLFMAKEQWAEMAQKNIGALYAEYSDAMPRSINGYPIFTQVSILSKTDTAKVTAYIKAIRGAVDKMK